MFGVPDGETPNELHDCNLGCAEAFALVGDDTYAGIVFTPGVEGVEQVEVTLPFAEGAERTFTQEHRDKAEAYARLIAAAPDLLEVVRDTAERLSHLLTDKAIPVAVAGEVESWRASLEQAIAKATAN